MKFSELTEEQIQSLSEMELVDMDLSECVDKINHKSKSLNTLINHLIGVTLISVLSILIFPNIITYCFGIIPVVLFLICNRINNDKKTAMMLFKMTILYYQSCGLINESNKYLVNKHTENIEA